MDKSRLTAGLMTALLGGPLMVDTAEAVHLSNNGIGQALVYSYYTVNAQQQTVLSVVNSGSIAKAVKVRFREGYNGRAVLDFNLFLSPYDVWAGTVFALADAGLPSDGAAILTQDRSCTAPAFSEAGTTLPSSGQPYVAFREEGYLMPDDGGPYTIDRTREGHFEIIAMADLTGSFAAAVKHNATGVPANCAVVRNLVGSEPELIAPGSGLFGSAGIINVQAGTYFAYDADALENFTGRSLVPDTTQPNYVDLGAVNDGPGVLANQATALVVTPAGVTLSTYPGPDARSRRIDAVSAVFMADSLYNEFQVSAALAANTDWVVTFPTKSNYVDELLIGAGQTAAIPPFVSVYDGAATPGPSCARFENKVFDREERTPAPSSGFPGWPMLPLPRLCGQTNVVGFSDTTTLVSTSGVLKSRLVSNTRPLYAAGWARLSLDPQVSEPHALLAATNGNIHRGLPVTGFNAISVTNNNATVINGVSTLSNYSGTSKHRPATRCVNGAGACQ